MGWKEFIDTALDTSENGAGVLLQYGLLGNYIANKQSELMKESERKAGALCPPKCLREAEQCGECLKIQEEILNEITELELLEQKAQEVHNNPEKKLKRHLSKCTLCGAPLDIKYRKCPYCDTPYPMEDMMDEIPENKVERDRMVLERATQVYELYTDWSAGHWKSSMDSLGKEKKGKVMSVISGGISQMVESQLKMNKFQLQQGAAHYGISYSEYISGIIGGRYKTIGQMQLEQLSGEHRT